MRDLRWIVTKLNEGASLSELGRELGVNVSKISLELNKLIKRGEIVKTLVIPLHLLSERFSIIVVELYQKIPLSACLKRTRKYLKIFHSNLSRPYIVAYLEGEASYVKIEEVVNAEACRVLDVGAVSSIVLARRDPVREIVTISEMRRPPIQLDENDAFIAAVLFRIFNPPPLGKWTLRELRERLAYLVGEGTSRYHLERHLAKAVLKRYVIRGNGVYGLLYFKADNLATLSTLLRALFSSGILVDVEYISLISASPYSGVAHVWLDAHKFADASVSHEYVENCSYYIFPISRVYELP